MDNKKIEITVEKTVEATRLDAYLGKYPDLNLSRTKAEKLISDGSVKVNGELSNKKYIVQPGDNITLIIAPPPKTEIKGEDIPLEVVYEDDYLLVVNKPAGMVTHPAAGNYSGTLVNALVHRFDNLPSDDKERPGIVHRLDKNTSGLIMVAKDEVSFRKLQKAIQNREVKRTYHAIICGHLKKNEGEIDLPIGRSVKDRKKMTVTDLNSREAVTIYKVLRRYRTYDLLELQLQTGRTHQIRVHLSHLGHPVLGDPEYGGRDKWHKGIFAPERPLGQKLLKTLRRQALHSKSLVFNHPIIGSEIVCDSDLPDDFQAALDLLESEGA